jgi:hypothetical protein
MEEDFDDSNELEYDTASDDVVSVEEGSAGGLEPNGFFLFLNFTITQQMLFGGRKGKDWIRIGRTGILGSSPLICFTKNSHVNYF